MKVPSSKKNQTAATIRTILKEHSLSNELPVFDPDDVGRFVAYQAFKKINAGSFQFPKTIQFLKKN